LNLASLTIMRRDLKLATYYLNKAAGIDPKDSRLALLRQQLTNIESQERTPYQFKQTWPEVAVVKRSI